MNPFLRRVLGTLLLIAILFTVGVFVDLITQFQGIEKTLARIAAAAIGIAGVAGMIVAIEWIFARLVQLLGLQKEFLRFLWERSTRDPDEDDPTDA